MPLPLKIKITKPTGPAPLCECGICSVCKNRERQRKWRERQMYATLVRDSEESAPSNTEEVDE